MAGPAASRGLIAARDCLREALHQWQAFDMSKIDTARALVEQSSSFLLGMPPSRDATVVLAEMRQDLTRLARLVDAGSAFYRGLGLRRNGGATAYLADGRVAEESTAATCGLQG